MYHTTKKTNVKGRVHKLGYNMMVWATLHDIPQPLKDIFQYFHLNSFLYVIV